ncbi:aminopeptidase P family protein [Candidatus Woesearchaeota archaeon]|nr:aminopeptidase P family protein [Candidatus Woesearchaeota archaeon]
MESIQDQLPVKVCTLPKATISNMTRIKHLQKILDEKKIDYLILMNDGNSIDPHMVYYTNIKVEYALLIVPNKGSALFAVPSLEYERVQRVLSQKTIKIILKEWKPGFLKQFFALPRKNNGRKIEKIGVNYAALSLLSSQAIRKATGRKQIDMSQALRALRMVKTKEEIALIKRACAMTTTIIQEVKAFLSKKKKEFVTEQDVVAFMEAAMKQRGVEPAFPMIVASGKHGAMPHYVPQRKVLQNGFLVIDVGVRYKGYCSDITRTFYVGNPSEKERQAYLGVMRAQEASLHQVREGTPAKHVDQAARKVLGEKYFIHSTGHGLGMDVHEGPNISKTSVDVLQEGMVITIEPGIYFPNAYGIRIEDDVLVKKDGYEVLTKMSSSFNDIVIKK